MTAELLQECLPKASLKNIVRFVAPLTEAMNVYEINTPKRQAMFLAQAAHESSSLSATRENFNYSAEGLLKTFSKYFTAANVGLYAHKPEAIANKVYANRMGNHDELSGDGWKFRGAGLFQTTGAEGFAEVAGALGIDCVNKPELLEQPQYAALSAGLFWSRRGLNVLADKDYIETVTRKINGGLNGLDDRVQRWAICKTALGIV